MNAKHLFMIVITSSALVLTGSVFAADTANPASADAKAEKAEKPKKAKVKPHSHPRDAKGMSMHDKSDSKEASSESTSGTSGNQTVKPHSHPRDAK